jgi:hypothetical protein
VCQTAQRKYICSLEIKLLYKIYPRKRRSEKVRDCKWSKREIAKGDKATKPYQFQHERGTLARNPNQFNNLFSMVHRLYPNSLKSNCMSCSSCHLQSFGFLFLFLLFFKKKKFFLIFAVGIEMNEYLIFTMQNKRPTKISYRDRPTFGFSNLLD